MGKDIVNRAKIFCLTAKFFQSDFLGECLGNKPDRQEPGAAIQAAAFCICSFPDHDVSFGETFHVNNFRNSY